MEKDEKKSDVVEEKESEATEEIATPTPYKHPSRNLMDKENEKTATEESKEEPDEEKPKEEHPVGVEDAVFKKRYDDLKRHYDETISKHKDEVLKLKKEKEAIASKPIFKSKEDLEDWRRDNPEMYDSVMQLTTEATVKAKQEMEEQLLQVKKQQTQLARDRAEVELAKRHPDFKDIRESADFHDWASVQDSTIQSWLYDNTDNPKSAARAIDLYKYDRGLSTKKVTYDAKKEAAKSVSKTKPSDTPTDKKVWKWSDIQKMKPDVYAKFEKDIDIAHREGRIQ
jgi:hypothetical protein|tara:strand:- start:205 stop:1053 length:849 start_codon:yes stop_codon:yes gene_type:complete